MKTERKTVGRLANLLTQNRPDEIKDAFNVDFSIAFDLCCAVNSPLIDDRKRDSYAYALAERTIDGTLTR